LPALLIASRIALPSSSTPFAWSGESARLRLEALDEHGHLATGICAGATRSRALGEGAGWIVGRFGLRSARAGACRCARRSAGCTAQAALGTRKTSGPAFGKDPEIGRHARKERHIVIRNLDDRGVDHDVLDRLRPKPDELDCSGTKVRPEYAVTVNSTGWPGFTRPTSDSSTFT